MKNPQQLFSDLLDRFAQESHCYRRKVACLAVKDNRIISTGLNGTPSGEENCDVHFDGYDKDSEDFRKEHHTWCLNKELHSEENCIAYAARKGISLEGCDIYCSLAPCVSCTRLLAALKPKRVFYKEAYDKSDVLYIKEFFDKIGIEFIKLEGDSNEK